MERIINNNIVDDKYTTFILFHSKNHKFYRLILAIFPPEGRGERKETILRRLFSFEHALIPLFNPIFFCRDFSPFPF